MPINPPKTPVPADRAIDFDATTYGWAGGSLAGLFLGALAAAVVGAVRIRARWKLVQDAVGADEMTQRE